jgi:hypothetical protein
MVVKWVGSTVRDEIDGKETTVVEGLGAQTT